MKPRYFIVFYQFIYGNAEFLGHRNIESIDGIYPSKEGVYYIIAEQEGIDPKDICLTAPIQELTKEDYNNWIKKE